MDHDSYDIAFFSDSPSSPFTTGKTCFKNFELPKKPHATVHSRSSGFKKQTHTYVVFNLGLTSSFPIQNRKYIPIICRKLQV